MGIKVSASRGGFRKGADAVLVTTDIAPRGIDVPAAGHVISTMFPGSLTPAFIAPAGLRYALPIKFDCWWIHGALNA